MIIRKKIAKLSFFVVAIKNDDVIQNSKKIFRNSPNEKIYDGLPTYLIELPKLDRDVRNKV